MKTATILGTTLVAACMVMGACDRKNDQDTAGRTTSPSTSQSGNASTNAGNTSGRTQTDTNSSSRTPDSTSGISDSKIAAEVHRVIMDDKTLSTSAQNCKVSADKAGVVTLSGTVASQAEKDAVEAKAKAVAGVTRVVNELEVQTK